MAFDPTNRDHKKQLYPVLRAIADIDPRTSPELLIDQACGQPLARGTDYLHNVRKGDFAKSIAQLVHIYLRDHHFDIAHKISPDIFPETPEMRWRQILDEQAVTGKLNIVPMKRSMGIVQRARVAAEITLKLGQEFCLELESDTEGHAILLQGLRDRWHPIPLVNGGDYHLAVTAGVTKFPQTANGLPDPIVENHDLGLHEFVVVLADRPEIPLTLEHLTIFTNSKFHRTNFKVVE